MNTIKVSPNEVRAGDVLVAYRFPTDTRFSHVAGSYARMWGVDYAARVVDVGTANGAVRVTMLDGNAVGLTADAIAWVRR